MKIKVVLIGTVVTAALVGGIGYGVYFSMQGKKQPIEVVPVSNVNTGFWGDSESIYGTITSQVSQTISLKDEYPIEEIFVSEGDSVKEGTPLFSYDMTLPELELEMEELTLQTYQLNLAKMEKDLTKLKTTGITASLQVNEFQMTASAEDGDVIMETLPDETGEQEKDTKEEGKTNTKPVVQVAGIEEIDNVPADVEEKSDQEESGETKKTDTSIAGSAVAYEQLVASIETLFEEYGDELTSSDIASAVRYAVKYYRKNLADQKIEQRKAQDGSSIDVISYEIKESVKQELGEEAAKELQKYSQKMDTYHLKYVEMLIQEANTVSEQERQQALAIIQEEYAYLTTAQQEELSSTGILQNDLFSNGKAETGNTNGAGSENETQSSETGAGSENETQSSETGTESESETKNETETESESETKNETGTESESETQSEIGTESESENKSETEAETETDLTVALKDFQTKAEAIFMEGAQPTKEEYQAAIDLYQQFLAVPQADIADLQMNAKMEEYRLTDAITAYLNAKSDTAVQELTDTYQRLCFSYVRFMITKMDPYVLVREELEEAKLAYSMLGLEWQNLLEQKWQAEQMEAALPPETESNDLTQTTEAETDVQPTAGTTGNTAVFASLSDHLIAYDMILSIQELDLNQSKKELKEALKGLRETYLSLSEIQKSLVWNRDELITLLTKYKLWELETESESEMWDDDWDDGWDDWGDSGYTAEELQEMVKEKEREIKECELDIREAEIAVRKKQRIVDDKIVKSTMDGTVISIGDIDGSSENDYFAKIANDDGLYARGAMNELALEKIKVGDTISGITLDEGISFTAVIKEISEYPQAGESGYYGNENTNSSYYPFYALINDPEGIEQGEAEIQLSETMINEMDAIYLELYFVREDSNGKSYVMKQDEQGLLTKQIVETGKTVSNYAVQIVSGLSAEDRIAFPYGDGVVEGAQTKEVDMLEAAYR